MDRKSLTYLRNAATCRKMAQRARHDDRATFLDLAQHWEAMAEIEARIIETMKALDPETAAWSVKARRAA